ncbi:hypothetical protein SK128_026647 [Halocaridina rubra]|uniref:Uncharacterized protein n=1 Tax=Halocaridina rubra TaxID=373956 RepID=A0AAN9A2E3_HALRR
MVTKYDKGEFLIGDEEFYSMASPTMDDPYNDRRQLVPNRRRAAKVPGEEVILEEDILEEEEEEEDLEEEEREDDDEENDEEENSQNKQNSEKAPKETLIMKEEKKRDFEANDEKSHFHNREILKAKSSSYVCTDSGDAAVRKPGTRAVSIKDRVTTAAESKDLHYRSGQNSDDSSPTVKDSVPSEETVCEELHKYGKISSGTERKSSTTYHSGSTTNVASKPTVNKVKRIKCSLGAGSRNSQSLDMRGRARAMLNSKLRNRRDDDTPGNDVVVTGIDNPCYAR